jgi:adenylate kinase family enzyme
MNLIFLGAPGSERARRLKCSQKASVSVGLHGNFLRKAVKDATPLGKKAEK